MGITVFTGGIEGAGRLIDPNKSNVTSEKIAEDKTVCSVDGSYLTCDFQKFWRPAAPLRKRNPPRNAKSRPPFEDASASIPAPATTPRLSTTPS